MANKVDYNIILALLHDTSGDPVNMAGSTGAIAEANGKDGFQKKDAQEAAADSVLDQSGDFLQKIFFTLGQHPDIAEDLSESIGRDITPILLSGNINNIRSLFFNYLKSKGIEEKRIMGEGGQFETNDKIVKVTINEKEYSLLRFITEEEKETGLMNVEEMESDEGGLFDYSKDPQDSISFWMKDTSIPLKILFIGKDGIVLSVHNGVPFSEEPITESSEPVYWVIELNQSELIEEGDETSLSTDDTKDNRLYIYGPGGEIQGQIEAGARIFSRPNTRTLIKLCKRAYSSNSDTDYKRVGRKIFEYIKQQDTRKPEYVN